MDYVINLPVYYVAGLGTLFAIFLVFFGVTVVVIIARWVVSWVTG